MSMKERDFDLFIEGLRKAAARVADHCFELPIATKKGSKKAFRERVYCYELYHQLRIVLGDRFPYKLHGEVDKSGHEIVPGKKKPDFIIHDPGDMDKNLAVIEVKPANVTNNIEDLEKDLKTLEIFLGKKVKYYRGIMLVYSEHREKIPENILSMVTDYSKKLGNRILLMWHNGCYTEPDIIYFGHRRARE